MDILDYMTFEQEGLAVARMGGHFGLSEGQLALALEYVVPLLDDALTRLMASPQGLAAILAQLASNQYQRDISAADLFDNSRILANGTGALSLLLRNEPIIRIVSFVAAEGAALDVALIRRMMPYIAIIYVSALAKRSKEPLHDFAQSVASTIPQNGHGSHNLAELVLSKSSMQKASTAYENNRGSIKDILNALSKIEDEPEYCYLK